MGRTVFIDTDVITSQLDSLSTNRFSFGFLCGQCTRSERDYIHYIIDGIASKQTDLDSFFDSSSINKELWAKIIEITSSLCAGVSIIGFYCRAKTDILKSTNFTLKIRRLFEVLQTALRTYSPWSLTQSSNRILLQSELGSGANKWLIKTMDMNSDNVHFRPVEMKTYDSKTSSVWCMTTAIPIQFNVWLNRIINNNDSNIKVIENQFEQQWKEYTDNLKESLLLMDDRLLSLDTLKLSSKTSKNSVDIQWLSPIDSLISNEDSNENRICYKFDGSASLRFFTCHSEITGNDIRQYFIEDLFRSILIRLNLVLINMESNPNENISIDKLILPRRVYINRPVFISAYQLVHESLPMVIDSLQENFKITSVLEEDLEVAEEFPSEITNDERLKQFNTNINKNEKQGTSRTRRNIYQNVIAMIEKYFGTGNATLVISITTVLVLLITAKPSRCRKNEVLVNCVEPCQPSCSWPNRPKCPTFACSKGCECASGYLLETNGTNSLCIKCNQKPACGNNEEISTCANPCQPSCSWKKRPACPTFTCSVGCACQKNFYRATNETNSHCVKC